MPTAPSDNSTQPAPTEPSDPPPDEEQLKLERLRDDILNSAFVKRWKQLRERGTE